MLAISILHSSEINIEKWNNCVAENSNGLIYANSNYLDTMAENWYGLIVNNYELIFPICIRKKYGITYSYMPAFTQQLGFIGNTQLITTDVIKKIQQFVKYASPYLNYDNEVFAKENDCIEKHNYIINLNETYLQIKKKYKKSITYSLAKAAKQNFIYTEDDDISLAINLYKQSNLLKMEHVNNTDYKNLKILLKKLQNNNQVLIRKIVNANNELLSIVLLMKDNKRYYNIINATTDEGRKSESNYFLYNNLLQELAEQNMIFDFEGSDLKGVKSFYEKFGAINQPYFHWHYNNLPKVISWLKK